MRACAPHAVLRGASRIEEAVESIFLGLSIAERHGQHVAQVEERGASVRVSLPEWTVRHLARADLEPARST